TPLSYLNNISPGVIKSLAGSLGQIYWQTSIYNTFGTLSVASPTLLSNPGRSINLSSNGTVQVLASLQIGPSARYYMSGGTLDIKVPGGLNVRGMLDYAGGSQAANSAKPIIDGGTIGYAYGGISLTIPSRFEVIISGTSQLSTSVPSGAIL